MNLFNRIIVILLCLGLIGGAASLIALTWTLDVDTIAWLRDAVDWIDENNADLERAIFTAMMAALGFFALLILLMELTPRGTGEVRVSDLQAGNAVLSTAAVGQRIEEAVRAVPHVADVRTYIKGKRKGVAVALDLHVDSEADLAQVTDQVSSTVRDVLTNRVHVALAEPPRVRLHYRELRLNRGQRPTVVTPVPAPVTQIPEDLRSRDPATPISEAEGFNDPEAVPVTVGATSSESDEQRRDDERKPD
jgi:hypothetical protein